MKRVLAVLAVLVLLTGCTSEPKPTTIPSTGPTAPTVSLYDPNSDVEEDTSGAVRAYPMTGHDIQGFRFLGRDMVLFTTDEHVELTTLLLLRGDTLKVAGSRTLDIGLYPDDSHLRIGEDSVAYYNQAENSLVILDSQLAQSRRLQLPDEMTDVPVINGAMDTLYYCAADEIRALDLNTGISRLLKQHTCVSQRAVRLHFNDTVLEVYVTDETGAGYVAFVSTENGQTIGTDESIMTVHSVGNSYLLQRHDGIVVENLVGKLDDQPKTLEIGGASVVCEALSMNAVLAGSDESIALYDLASGKVISRVSLGEDVQISFASADPGGNFVWIQGYDKSLACDVLYRWDITATEVAEDEVYLHKRYTVAEPDKKSIAACQSRADAIGEKLGVKLYVGEALPLPEGYEFTYEHQPEAFERVLSQLEQLLSLYPEGFFAGLSQVSKSGAIHIGFVRDMKDSTGAAVPDGSGLHYVLNGDHYIAISVLGDLEHTVHHELCHALDSKVYSVSKAFDLWEQLNPKDFTYLGTYQDYTPAPDDPNLQGETQAFVDAYAMSFVKEDRARLFEYAMIAGNEQMFAAETMQKKLQQLCLGIREAYGWEETELVLPWEQYLAVDNNA